MDQTILQYSPITVPDAGDYLVVARVGGNRKIKVSDLFATALLVTSFNTRTGAVVLQSSDLNGLSGAGLSGIGTGTGGVINTGTTTIGGDSDADGVGTVAIQTRGLNRIVVANNGKVGFAGQTSPTGWLDVASGDGEIVLRAARATGSIYGFSFLQNQDASCGPFEWIVNSGVNPGGLRRDTYCQFGYNPRAVTDDMRLYFAIETRWNPGGTQVQNEVYLEYLSPSNGGGAASIRPLGWTIREDIQSIQTDMFTTTFKIYDWPGHPGADHPYADFAYPNLRIAEGNLLINPDSRASIDNLNAILIRGLRAVEIDSSGLIQVGDSGAALGVLLRGNVGINSDGPNSQARLWLQSSAVGQANLLLDCTYAGTQTAPLLRARNAAGVPTFEIMPDGTLKVWDGADLNVVSIGAADSGGTGYRYLRIPN